MRKLSQNSCRWKLSLSLDLNLHNPLIEFITFEPQCLQCIITILYCWPSMPPIHQKKIIWFDINASNPSELFFVNGPHCLQCIRTIPHYWTSIPPMHQNYASHSRSDPVNKSASQPSNRQGSKQDSKPAIQQARG